MLKWLVHRIGGSYTQAVTKRQAFRQKFRRTNERPIEYSFVFAWLNRLQPQTVLDVGTGESALPALVRTCGFVVTAVDNVKDYWPKGMVNSHWYVEDEDITLGGSNSQYDVVLCISVLEHIRDTRAAIKGLLERTRPGGHLILTTPFGAHSYANAYEQAGSYGAGNPYPCRQHGPEDLADWLASGFQLVAEDYWVAFDSEVWSVGQLVRPLRPSEQPANLGCFVLRRSATHVQS